MDSLQFIYAPFVSVLSLVLYHYLMSRLATQRERLTEQREKHRDSFERLLDAHVELFLTRNIRHEDNPKRTEQQLDAAKRILLWASDAVLYNYALFFQSISPETFAKTTEAERHFGNTILAFRKDHLGFKNKRLGSAHIVIIFKVGWRVELP